MLLILLYGNQFRQVHASQREEVLGNLTAKIKAIVMKGKDFHLPAWQKRNEGHNLQCYFGEQLSEAVC